MPKEEANEQLLIKYEVNFKGKLKWDSLSIGLKLEEGRGVTGVLYLYPAIQKYRQHRDGVVSVAAPRILSKMVIRKLKLYKI